MGASWSDWLDTPVDVVDWDLKLAKVEQRAVNAVQAKAQRDAEQAAAKRSDAQNLSANPQQHGWMQQMGQLIPKG